MKLKAYYARVELSDQAEKDELKGQTLCFFSPSPGLGEE